MDDGVLDVVRNLLDCRGPALELYARQWCQSPEDVVQEAMLRLARESPLPRKPLAWLYVAVRRGAISAARAESRRRGHEAAAAGAPWFEPTPGDVLDAQAATAALAQLPIDQREVLVARLWGGLSFHEIGELVGCSSSAAHRRYEAGLIALRERLGATCEKTNPFRKS